MRRPVGVLKKKLAMKLWRLSGDWKISFPIKVKRWLVYARDAVSLKQSIEQLMGGAVTSVAKTCSNRRS
jgi:hypothetical protein